MNVRQCGVVLLGMFIVEEHLSIGVDFPVFDNRTIFLQNFTYTVVFVHFLV